MPSKSYIPGLDISSRQTQNKNRLGKLDIPYHPMSARNANKPSQYFIELRKPADDRGEGEGDEYFEHSARLAIDSNSQR